MSDCSRQSIENAKKMMMNVEFITRKINNSDLIKIYSKLHQLSENTCACPSLAYLLFYPELVANKVPYFVVGNEPVQMKNLYLNGMAPKIAYHFYDNKFFTFIINLGRCISLHPPFKRGQLHSLMTMKQLVKLNFFVKKYSKNDLLKNVCIALDEVPTLKVALKKAVRQSSWSGNIPAFVHFDLDDVTDGLYD